MGMGLFDRKRVLCPPGIWTNIIWNFGSGYPKTFQVEFTPTGEGPPAGQYRERRAFWIVPLAPVAGPITAKMEFHRNWINAYYTLSVKPENEMWAEVL